MGASRCSRMAANLPTSSSSSVFGSVHPHQRSPLWMRRTHLMALRFPTSSLPVDAEVVRLRKLCYLLIASFATTLAAAKPPVPPKVAKQTAAVVAANPMAVEAGVEILRKGGSAVDAAVAAQAMLGLVEPQSSGVGGGSFMMYYDAKTNVITALDGREKAPAGATPDMFLDENGKPMSYVQAVRTGRSTGVPGAINMLYEAHGRMGKLPWREL